MYQVLPDDTLYWMNNNIEDFLKDVSYVCQQFGVAYDGFSYNPYIPQNRNVNVLIVQKYFYITDVKPRMVYIHNSHIEARQKLAQKVAQYFVDYVESYDTFQLTLSRYNVVAQDIINIMLERNYNKQEWPILVLQSITDVATDAIKAALTKYSFDMSKLRKIDSFGNL